MLTSNDKWFSLIGRKLRGDGDVDTREPMPRRWVDLIRYLDEQERKHSEVREQPEAEPRVRRKN